MVRDREQTKKAFSCIISFGPFCDVSVAELEAGLYQQSCFLWHQYSPLACQHGSAAHSPPPHGHQTHKLWIKKSISTWFNITTWYISTKALYLQVFLYLWILRLIFTSVNCTAFQRAPLHVALCPTNWNV